MRHSIVHFLWRLAWGAYEMRRNRITRAAFDRLDAMHTPGCYGRREYDVVFFGSTTGKTYIGRRHRRRMR